mmetsp:Transcript_24567/g.22319  ORF Transcript_24567/g.22319 Transcript_24567/m.22319 type:complete len:235 (-) Transcript_24567:33-737(-)
MATGIDADYITFDKTVVVSTNRRLLYKESIDMLDLFLYQLDNIVEPNRQLLSYTLAVYTNTSIPLTGEYESFKSNPELLYANIIGNLSESIVSNSFTSLLNNASIQIGATQLINSVANNITSTKPLIKAPQTLSPTSLPTYLPTKSSNYHHISAGNISAAVIMSVFGFTLIALGLYYYYISCIVKPNSNTEFSRPDRPIDNSNSIDFDIIESGDVVVKEKKIHWTPQEVHNSEF